MIKIAVIGAAGRMGGAIIRALENDEKMSLGCALEHPESVMLGKDAGKTAQLNRKQQHVYGELLVDK